MKSKSLKISGKLRALALVAALALTALLVTANLTPASAARQRLTRQQVIELLAPHLENESGEIYVRLLNRPLPRGAVIKPMNGDQTIRLRRLSWFAFIDDHPSQLFQHPVRYAVIDDKKAKVKIYDRMDWPLIDGIPLGQEDGPEDQFTQIRSLPSARKRAPAIASSPDAIQSAPSGDYGDAPDEKTAYAGVAGRFPTLFNTTNSAVGAPGAHALITGQETLGASVSTEIDANDPADSDGVMNLVNADSDDGALLVLDTNVSPVTAILIFRIRVHPSAPAVTRYINAVFDFDRNGRWGGGNGLEWALRNLTYNLAPGQKITVVSPQFDWGTAAESPSSLWMRIVLSRTPVDEALFGAGGWDGSGQFSHGEVEDYFASTTDDDDDGGGGGGGGGDDPLPPGPEKTWDIPIAYHSLIIQGPDKPTQTICDEAADTMENLLDEQGYSGNRIDTTDMTEAEAIKAICDAIEGLQGKIKCADHILIYIIAHGDPPSAGPPGMDIGNGSISPEELDECLDKIPPCADLDCETEEKSCFVSVVIESCHAERFLAGVSGEGRNVFVSSSTDQPSWEGADGSGGEYSDRFDECSRDPAADANGDGAVTPEEAHDCASKRLDTPEEQTPKKNTQQCDCTCNHINQPPRCEAGPDRTALVGEQVTFDGSESFDPDGSIASYQWDFGDGSAASGKVVNHTYTEPGVYTAKLTVRDNEGASDSDTTVVTIARPRVEQGGVKGQVSDALTGRPISGAVIMIFDNAERMVAALQTGLNGGYDTGLNLPAGQYTVICEASGYEHQQKSAAVATGASAQVDFALNRRRSFFIR